MKKTKNTMADINDMALEALSDHAFVKAQDCFRLNAKQNPCLATYNNLGVFYIQENMELPDGRVRSAAKLGLKYLKKAEAYSQSQQNLMAIGDVYLSQKEYETAENYFRGACNLGNSYIAFNNLGASLYMQNKCKESLKYFEKAIDLCDHSDIKAEICVSYAYAMLEVDKKKCHKIITEIIGPNALSFPWQMFDADEFVLLYLCDDLQSASKLCKALFKQNFIESFVLAMIFDCLFKVGKDDEAKECLNLKIKSLEGYDYDIRKEVNEANKAFASPDFRKILIAKYSSGTPIIRDCYYCGCKHHNNPL